MIEGLAIMFGMVILTGIAFLIAFWIQDKKRQSHK